jgi:hypothetical protein
MNLAKSLIGSKKTIVIIAHLCSEMVVLGRNTIQFFQRSIRYSSSKHAVHSYLRNRTTAQTEYVWIVLLIIYWNFEYVNSFALRDTHRFKKRKIWNIAHFCSEKKKTPSVECSPAHRSDWYSTKNDPNSELPASINIIEFNRLKIWAIFKYINSLTRRDTWCNFSRKKHVKDTQW